MTQGIPLPKLEAEIEALLTAVETAEDPTKPFARLKAAITEYKARSRELREDWYKQRNTIARQAAAISDGELDALAGYRAPSPGESQTTYIQTVPDVIAVESAPNCLFVQLSHGFVNLLQIVDFDLESKTLFTSNGMRKLTDADTSKLTYLFKLYSSK